MSRKANSRGLCFRAEHKLSGRERFYFYWSACHGDDASIGCLTMFCQPLQTGRCSQRGAPICASCKDLSQLSTFKLSFSTSSSLSLAIITVPHLVTTLGFRFSLCPCGSQLCVLCSPCCSPSPLGFCREPQPSCAGCSWHPCLRPGHAWTSSCLLRVLGGGHRMAQMTQLGSHQCQLLSPAVGGKLGPAAHKVGMLRDNVPGKLLPPREVTLKCAACGFQRGRVVSGEVS